MTQPQQRNPVEELAEAFLERYRRGEGPSLSEYIRGHPGLDDEIRDLFPALVLMEEAGRELANAGPGGAVAANGLPLDKLADYRILQEAGRGGMGVVYEAVQESLGRRVALKVFPFDGAHDPTRLMRFHREARTAARLHHTNIVPVFEVGEEQGVHYYAMQFIQGQRLDKLIGTGPSFPQSEFHIPYFKKVARLGLQVAEALAHAHAQKVIHRDIKPSNLLLDEDGTVWITDFGLAKEEGDDLTRTGDVVGTLRYMAPEQFAGDSDARSDIYSLGLTLYELLTRRPAFEDSDRGRLVRRVTQEEPPRPRQLVPGLPKDLETIVLKAIAKEPGRRYGSAVEMAEDLRRFLADRPILARRTSWAEHTWRWARRNPGWAATLAVTLTLLLITAIGGTVLSASLRQALTDVQTAEHDKTEKLWQSYLDRARAERSSGRVGQRFKSLEAIREAAKTRITPELRDEAVAALVLPDIELIREWEGYPEDSIALASDAALVRYARLNKQGEVTVCRRTEEAEQVLFRLPVHGKPSYHGLWLSPDDRFLAYGHSYAPYAVSGELRVWRLDGPTPTVLFDEPAGCQRVALAFRPDGRQMAVGHANKTITVYDLETGLPCRRLELGELPARLAFHPRDGRLAAVWANAIRFFDGDTGRELPPIRQPQTVTVTHSLAWHPDGRILATGGNDSMLRLWDVEKQAEVAAWEVPTGDASDLAFNHAGDRLLSTDWSGGIHLWDAYTGRRLLTLPPGFMIQFGPSDDLLGFRREGTKLQLWRLAEGRELRGLRRRGADSLERIHSPVPHPDGRVLTAGSGRWLSFFDLERGEELASVRLPHLESAYPRVYSPGKGWLTGGLAGALHWPVQPDPARDGDLLVGPPRRLGPSSEFATAGVSRDGRVLAIPRRSDALLLDRDRPGWRAALGPQHDVRSCAVSPDGRWVVTCSHWWDDRSPSVRVWDGLTGRHAHDLQFGNQTTAAFSPDGRFLATSAPGWGCRLWDVGTWRERQRFPDASFVFSPDSRLLALSDPRSALRLVEAESGREVVRLTGPEAISYWPVAFSPDGARLVTQPSGCKSLFVWDLRLLRTQLRELGMDWDGPEYSPPSSSARPPSVRVDPGFLRAPPAQDDRLVIAFSSISLAFLPLNPDAHFHRGQAYDRLGMPQEAVADYAAYLALASSDDLRRIEALRRRAENYVWNLRDYPAGMAALQDLQRVEKDDLPWLNVLASTGNEVAWHYIVAVPVERWPAGVLALAEKAVEIEPHNADYLNTRGAVLYRLGRYVEAVRCLEENLRRPQRTLVFDHFFLAMAYQRLGQGEKARASFDAASDWHRTLKSLTAAQEAELAVFHAEAAALLGLPAPPIPKK